MKTIEQALATVPNGYNWLVRKMENEKYFANISAPWATNLPLIRGRPDPNIGYYRGTGATPIQAIEQALEQLNGELLLRG